MPCAHKEDLGTRGRSVFCSRIRDRLGGLGSRMVRSGSDTLLFSLAGEGRGGQSLGHGVLFLYVERALHLRETIFPFSFFFNLGKHAKISFITISVLIL